MGLHSTDRQYRADAAVTQPQPAPKRDTQIDTKQDVAESGLPTRTCVAIAPAEIAGQQDCTDAPRRWWWQLRS